MATSDIKNPWREISIANPPRYILKDDEAAIKKADSGERFCDLQLQLLPEPFVGDPTKAHVVILQLNPGYHTEDDHRHQKPEFQRAALANLRHTPVGDYPFYLLDPQFRESAGGKYWRKRFW